MFYQTSTIRAIVLGLLLLGTRGATGGELFAGNDCCNPRPHHHFFWKCPPHPFGRNHTCDTPKGTCGSCPPQGPYFGYFSTCWHRWPQDFQNCPVSDWYGAPCGTEVPGEAISPGAPATLTPPATPPTPPALQAPTSPSDARPARPQAPSPAPAPAPSKQLGPTPAEDDESSWQDHLPQLPFASRRSAAAPPQASPQPAPLPAVVRKPVVAIPPMPQQALPQQAPLAAEVPPIVMPSVVKKPTPAPTPVVKRPTAVIEPVAIAAPQIEPEVIAEAADEIAEAEEALNTAEPEADKVESTPSEMEVADAQIEEATGEADQAVERPATRLQPTLVEVSAKPQAPIAKPAEQIEPAAPVAVKAPAVVKTAAREPSAPKPLEKSAPNLKLQLEPLPLEAAETSVESLPLRANPVRQPQATSAANPVRLQTKQPTTARLAPSNPLR